MRTSERSEKVQAEKQIARKFLYPVASATRSSFVRVPDGDTTRTRRYELHKDNAYLAYYIDDSFERVSLPFFGLCLKFI